ncbi:TPA: hypothetical protein DCW61_00795 [Candidatus Uhrbacteria bacterium]|nr:hypothetical protein [Candidatus Uhrbacteria bacterium]
MEPKQDTLDDIINSEHDMVRSAPDRFGEHFQFAFEAHALLNDFILSVDASRFVFTIFLSQMRKHSLLALLSTLRLHRTQALMDVRQVLEAGVNAAYAILQPDISHFAEFDEHRFIETPKKLSHKRYQWLTANHPKASRSIQGMKDIINDSISHSNLVSGMLNFVPDLKNDAFGTPFFDIEDEYHIKNDLWMVGDVLIGFMDLFYGVSRTTPEAMKFSSDFIERIRALRIKDDQLKQEVMTSERFIKTMESKTQSTKK